MGPFQVIFMDAGQGDCTLIVYPDGSLTLVDCGSTKSGTAAFVEIKKVIDNHYSKDRDFSLVLTHPDEDHYNLLKKLDILKYINGSRTFNVYYGGHTNLYGNSKDSDFTKNLLVRLQRGGVAFPPDSSTSTTPDILLSRAGVDVTILASNCTGDRLSTTSAGKNSNSIVLLVEYQGAKLFLMGDAFVRTEEFIMAAFRKAKKLSRLQKQKGETVVLKLGHHGSDTSTGTEWVELIEPDIIVVSSGTKIFNGKGMPTEVLVNEVMQETKLTNDGIDQSYVVFDESKRGQTDQEFKTMPKTRQAVWTTCYNVEWKGNTIKWFESGQTWYYGVDMTGKKVVDHWYGYTGYEV